MAPTIENRPAIRSKILKSSAKVSKSSENSLQASKRLIGSTKKDKRLKRRSAFLSRIAKPTTATTKKRKTRPSKKLITDLESLVNALPDVSSRAEMKVDDGRPLIKYKSFTTKPGAMKRKELLIKMEKERFNQNLVALHKGTEDMMAQGEIHYATENKWKAIRGFIEQTIERHPDADVVAGVRVTSEHSTQ